MRDAASGLLDPLDLSMPVDADLRAVFTELQARLLEMAAVHYERTDARKRLGDVLSGRVGEGGGGGEGGAAVDDNGGKCDRVKFNVPAGDGTLQVEYRHGNMLGGGGRTVVVTGEGDGKEELLNLLKTEDVDKAVAKFISSRRC